MNSTFTLLIMASIHLALLPVCSVHESDCKHYSTLFLVYTTLSSSLLRSNPSLIFTNKASEIMQTSSFGRFWAELSKLCKQTIRSRHVRSVGAESQMASMIDFVEGEKDLIQVTWLESDHQVTCNYAGSKSGEFLFQTRRFDICR